MKTTRKLLSLLLCLVMAAAVVPTVFADPLPVPQVTRNGDFLQWPEIPDAEFYAIQTSTNGLGVHEGYTVTIENGIVSFNMRERIETIHNNTAGRYRVTVYAVKSDPPGSYNYTMVSDYWEGEYDYNMPIFSVNVSNVKEPVAGEYSLTDSTYQTATLPTYANYTLHGIEWYDENDNWLNNAAFEEGKTYICKIMIAPNEGNIFNTNVFTTVNGTDTGIVNVEVVDGMLQISKRFTVGGASLVDVNLVEVNDVKMPVAGELSSDASYQAYTLPASANYYVDTFEWFDEDVRPLTAPFEEGKTYICVVGIKLNPGYQFVRELRAVLNGESLLHSNISAGDITVTLWKEYTVPTTGEQPIVTPPAETPTTPVQETPKINPSTLAAESGSMNMAQSTAFFAVCVVLSAVVLYKKREENNG